ncbi:TPA: hypothetical protein JBE46_00475 [Legionella pneumophila subsp. pneumophila]|nr:hypothetical protein DM454_11545 [Legionella pneumophila]HAT8876027.1 hypothetical protein [Legionella pneumophila subsp. pneumophila]PYB48887.1 hypothetical protein DM456_12225 [Legionella pneumophila]PYB61976.1 hypothetical protein DM455_11495 [Legionella pneumophila]TID57941.1 hypothetical protein DIZ40_12650 [Legionella pneumophila]
MGFIVPLGLILPTPKEHTMQQQEPAQLEIEHLLFELNCCVNDLSRHRLQINPYDIQQAELSLHKLESLISFVKQFDTQRIAC